MYNLIWTFYQLVSFIIIFFSIDVLLNFFYYFYLSLSLFFFGWVRVTTSENSNLNHNLIIKISKQN